MTNEDRWLVARYCGFSIVRCETCEPSCGDYEMHRNGEMVSHSAWWTHDPTVDELAEELPRFDSDPAQVVTMMESMMKESPSIRYMGQSGWRCGVFNRLAEYAPTIPPAVFATCLACAKEKYEVAL